MEYKKFGGVYYVRVDKGDEIIGTLLEISKKEGIASATFSGIGGLKSAEIQTFIPETGTFETEMVSGMLELVSLMGNTMSEDDGSLYFHAHAMVSFRDADGHHVMAGHVKSLTVLYTAEIELRPVCGGTIYRQRDPETGTGFWKL